MKIECVIKSPQFMGSQDKFWLKEQSGLFDTENLLFVPDSNYKNDQGLVGKHKVQFHERHDFDKARIK
jgi:hypothetical protein